MSSERYGELRSHEGPYECTIFGLTSEERQRVAINMDPICLPRIVAQKAEQGEHVMPGVQLETRTTLVQQCNANYCYLNSTGIRMAQIIGAVCDLREICANQASTESEAGQVFRRSSPGAPYLDPLTGEPMVGSGFFGIQGSLEKGWLAITDAEAQVLQRGIFDKLDALGPYAFCRAGQIINGLRDWPVGKALCEEWGIGGDSDRNNVKLDQIRLFEEAGNAPTEGERRLASEAEIKGGATTQLSSSLDELCEKAPRKRQGVWRTKTPSGDQLDVYFDRRLPSPQETMVLKKLTVQTPGPTDGDCRECYIVTIVRGENGIPQEVTYRWADNWRCGQGMQSVGLTRRVDKNTVVPVGIEEFVSVQKLVTAQVARRLKQWRRLY